MKYRYRVVLAFAFVGMAVPSMARQSSVNLSSQSSPVVISTMALFQSYEEDGPSVDQLSFPVSFSAPLGQDVQLSFQASQTSVSGDAVESLSGLSDAVVMFGYSTSLGNSSLVLNLGMSLPSGARELDTEEFQTLIVISQTAFDYRVPSLGQGFGASPGFALAVPVSRTIVVGAGASYRFRGGFKPIEGMEDDYTPGNEFLVTLGLDVSLGSRSSLSVDATNTVYAADKLGDAEVLEAGSKTTIAALFRHVRGFNEWRLLGLYRAREKSSQVGSPGLASAGVQTVPNDFMLQARYSRRFSTRFSGSFLAEVHTYDETPFYKSRDVYDVGIVPAIRLSQETTLVSRLIYTAGSISGFEAGVGLTVTL